MEITIEKIVYPGKSLGSSQGKKIFTDEGLPGELVNVKITREKASYAEAKTLSILKPSPDRIKPNCDHFKTCSGYQYIKYPKQLEIKETQVKEMFAHHFKITLEGNIIKPSPTIWGYRNKAHLHIIWQENKPYFAYHQQESFNEYVKIDNCSLLSAQMNKFLTAFLKIAADKKLDSIKELVIKESFTEKDLLIGLHLDSLTDKETLSRNLSVLKSAFPLKGVVCLSKEDKTFKETLLFGEDTLKETIENKIFFTGIQSFFQINIPMLTELTKDLKNELSNIDKNNIADLYCGVGTFGIMLASGRTKISFVEASSDNIFFLKKNIAANNIENFKIYKGESENFIEKILSKQIELLVLDPPRPGIDSRICEIILKKQPPLIMYLSCNPATLVRDLKFLFQGYKLKRLQLYDFFPHTPHIETLCILEKL